MKKIVVLLVILIAIGITAKYALTPKKSKKRLSEGLEGAPIFIPLSQNSNKLQTDNSKKSTETNKSVEDSVKFAENSTSSKKTVGDSANQNLATNSSKDPQNKLDKTLEENQLQDSSSNSGNNESVQKQKKPVKTLKKKTLKKKPQDKESPRNLKPKKSYITVTFEFLSQYPIPEEIKTFEQNLIPEEVRELDGKTVGIFGFMVPMEMDGLSVKKFLLARDQMACCFGSQPKVSEWISVDMKNKQSVLYFPNTPIAVIGTLHIRPQVEDGIVVNIYEMQATNLVSSNDNIFWEILKEAQEDSNLSEEQRTYYQKHLTPPQKNLQDVLK